MTSPQTIVQTDGEMLYYPDLFKDVAWKQIVDKVHWKHNDIKIFGKVHKEPRLTTWYGPSYKYSSIAWPSSPFPEFLWAMRTQLNNLCAKEFNAVLLNYYRSGQDSMGWHRDNEKEIDTSVIASVSFGASRTFQARHRSKGIKRSVELEHGSLLLMKNCQEHWEHQLPKRTRVDQPRLNLTFRRIIEA